jgi:alginate O-acetyltransferase complex protein AlgI
MLFNSFAFILVFLPVTLLGYFFLHRYEKYQLAKCWLVGASLFFYCFWTLKNLPILLTLLTVNFCLGRELHSTQPRWPKAILLKLGLLFNIGILCFFKYANFMNDITGSPFELGKLLLPLGLSFLVLQQIMYLMDAYEGMSKQKGILDYLVFGTFFPYLIAGPITHYEELMPQFEKKESLKFSPDRFSLGIFIFTMGLAKKILLAESFARWANTGFEESANLQLFTAWKVSLAYTFQLYFDFSGYSEMAFGISQMFNVDLPFNFNSPFKSKSIIEFWTRWHMSLSRFITTYIFTPIVRMMPSITFTNSMIATFLAMLIVGIWHGAGWTFTIYGGLHGIALVINHIWKKKRKKKKPYPFFGWFLTFNFVNISFVMFRATSVENALQVYRGMFGFNGVIIPKMFGISKESLFFKFGCKLGSIFKPDDYLVLVMLVAAFVLVLKAKSIPELSKNFKPSLRNAFLCAILFSLCLFGLNQITDFIYYKF